MNLLRPPFWGGGRDYEQERRDRTGDYAALGMENVMPTDAEIALLKTATDREIRLARALYHNNNLIASVHLNLGKNTIPIHNAMVDSMVALTPEDRMLANLVADMSNDVLAEIRKP